MARILLISNRSINDSCRNEELFGRGFNQSGPCELRIAEASCDPASRNWSIGLLPENHGSADFCYPSRALFDEIVSEVTQGASSSSRWVLFIPGYCSPCKEGLDKSLELSQNHDVNVLLFSWPSDPWHEVADAIQSYKRTQDAAKLSAIALRRALEGLQRVFVDPTRASKGGDNFRFSLLAHSLGNYVVQTYLQQPSPVDMDFSMFDNVILHQADVDFAACKEWVANIKARNETYITTNYFDSTLKNCSDLINTDRLGQASKGVFTPPGVTHVDFTSSEKVESQHWFFGNFPNQRIKTFCTRAIQGEDAKYSLFQDPTEPGRYQSVNGDTKIDTQSRRDK
jgi:esterase/lipase superfamily enzyme